ncbi:hypothetical protein L208DRAFT_1078502, partial [Tricholoma matsutake]
DSIIHPDSCVLCPECDSLIHLGKVSIVNYRKQHVGSTACTVKWEKERVVEKTKLNALKFFGPHHKPIPSNITTPPRVQATTLPLQNSLPRPSQIDPSPTPSSLACSIALQILNRFWMKIERLPESVPEASTSHAVTAFSFNPVGCVEDSKDTWEKWDGPLNRLLQQ